MSIEDKEIFDKAFKDFISTNIDFPDINFLGKSSLDEDCYYPFPSFLNVSSVSSAETKDGKYIIEMIQEMHKKIDTLATSEQVQNHDTQVKNEVIKNRKILRDKLEKIYMEFKKKSLRHQLSIHVSIWVFIFTVLTIICFFQGTIIINSAISGLFLLASILFLIMARKIPDIEGFSEIIDESSTE
ncbi:MAG: hypothetical protein C4541_13050 [Candidatus Auribacter fodinae]|jgi:hypothetical protein|uniref:Uncharacterized protein n=1 Tax=Candidatus Auribacter fodinae TaxID=2093366 RepID=A0A3A4QVK4_9BACT|nr:MAG: hypothetical protein C4541_13050 [Candidatus Auribacter fodinae]